MHEKKRSWRILSLSGSLVFGQPCFRLKYGLYSIIQNPDHHKLHCLQIVLFYRLALVYFDSSWCDAEACSCASCILENILENQFFSGIWYTAKLCLKMFWVLKLPILIVNDLPKMLAWKQRVHIHTILLNARRDLTTGVWWAAIEVFWHYCKYEKFQPLFHIQLGKTVKILNVTLSTRPVNILKRVCSINLWFRPPMRPRHNLRKRFLK